MARSANLRSKRSKGFDVFVKSVSCEIMKRNPIAQGTIEIRNIVEKEWAMLSEDQRKVYDAIAAK